MFLNKKLILLCVALSSTPFLASAANATHPFLEVVTENWKPYNYEDTDHKVKGDSTEKVRKILMKAGYKEVDSSNAKKEDSVFKIEVFPWSRSYKMAQEEPNTIIYTIIRIAPRENLFKWACPLGKGGTTSLYKLKTNKDIKITNVEEAKDGKKYKILTNNDSMDDTWLKFNKFTNLDTSSKVENAIKKFKEGRGNLIAFDDAVLESEFKSTGVDPGIAEKVIELFKTPPYMAFSKQTPDSVVAEVQKACDAASQ